MVQTSAEFLVTTKHTKSQQVSQYFNITTQILVRVSGNIFSNVSFRPDMWLNLLPSSHGPDLTISNASFRQTALLTFLVMWKNEISEKILGLFRVVMLSFYNRIQSKFEKYAPTNPQRVLIKGQIPSTGQKPG